MPSFETGKNINLVKYFEEAERKTRLQIPMSQIFMENCLKGKQWIKLDMQLVI